MCGRGACQLDEIRRCTFDLEANLARRDHHGRDIVHALVKHGRERLFHADRRAAAAYIAGKAQQFLDMHHLDRLFACRLGCFFQVKLLCDRNNEYMKAARFATCNQRLEYLIRVLTEQFRNERARELAGKYFLGKMEQVFEGVFGALMDKGLMKRVDPSILAFSFVTPIGALVQLCDREPEHVDWAFDRLRAFLAQFLGEYGIAAR